MLNKKQLVIKIVLKRVWYLVFGIIIIAMAVQLYLLKGTPSQPLNIHQLRSDVSYTDTPTLLIPGQGGNTITFNTFIKRAQNENIAQSAMVVRVSPTGQVRVKGSLKGKKNPLIQILYDWNYNVSFKPQMHQLTQVLIVLHQLSRQAFEYRRAFLWWDGISPRLSKQSETTKRNRVSKNRTVGRAGRRKLWHQYQVYGLAV